MNLSCTTLTEYFRVVRQLKIDGCPALSYHSNPNLWDYNTYIASRWGFHGYEWEIRFYPCQRSKYGGDDFTMALELVFLSQPRANHVNASLRCRLVDPMGGREPSPERVGPPKFFRRPFDLSERLAIMNGSAARSSCYLKDGSVTVECAINVYKIPEDINLPSPYLQKDLRELLRRATGGDVTFIVSGESVPAHKSILAARCPVFMAEFFGAMKEKTSRCIEIKEIEAPVFKAMLGFIYTDTVPEPDEDKETAMAMAQHLLVAADRYGLDRLKVMCERRVALGIDTGTVLTVLTLAEHHSFAQLKSRCLEFIMSSSAQNLDAILATGAYKNLEETNPSLVIELFKAAHKRINRSKGFVDANILLVTNVSPIL